jgi:hypothetical protein
MIYDPLLEIPVLFQSGPGVFSYSEAFNTEYIRRYGTPVIPEHRINNLRALDVYTTLSPWISNGPGANIQIAVVPLKARYAIKVKPIHNNGSEAVYIDTESYAQSRFREISYSMPEIVRREVASGNFSWLEGFKNEAFTLDGWIRIVRPRPLLQCGLQLYGRTVGYNPGSVIPITLEQGNSNCSAALGPVYLRLASNLPYRPDGGTSQPVQTTSPAQLNMFDSSEQRTKRSCTANNTKAQETTPNDSDDPDYEVTPKNTTDSGPSVDPELPCKVCADMDDWDRMLLCSKCNSGYHTFCVGLNQIPKGNWYCPPCQQKGKYKAISSPDLKSPHSPLPDDSHEEEDNWTTDEDDNERENSPPATTSTFIDILADTPVLHYLKTGDIQFDHLQDATPNEIKMEIKRIKKRAGNYRWNSKTNRVYKTATQRWPNDRLVVPPGPERTQLIDEIHGELGHLGIRKVCSMMQTRYYWKNITVDVQTHLKKCNECTRTKTLFKQQPELQCLPPAKMWDRVHIDTLGPLSATRLHRNRYLFVACCAGSKYLEAQAFREVNTENWCSFLADLFSRWGTCHTVVSDNATYYVNPEMQGFLHSVGVQHRFTNSYSPQSNGQAEAAVKCLLNSLQRSVGNTPDCWDEKLPWVLLGLRSAKHTTTGFSPLFVMTGRHAVLPSERRQQLKNEQETAQPPPLEEDPIIKEEDQQSPTQNPLNTIKDQTAQLNEFQAAFSSSPFPLDSAAANAALRSPPTTAPATDTTPLIDLTTDTPEEKDDHLDKPNTAFFNLRQQQAEQVQTQLRHNILARQEKQKRDFKKRHFHNEDIPRLQIGSLVLMKNPSAQRTKLHKGLACEGPYRLVQLMPEDHPTTATLEDAHKRRWTVSVKRLAPYTIATE